MLLRSVTLAAEMPLADMRGAVTCGLEPLRQRDLGERQLLVDDRTGEALRGEIAASGQPVGQVQSRGILASKDAGTRG